MADIALPQTAKHTIGMPSSSPLHLLHPSDIGMSLVEVAADILTAMSDA
jgi:hypothetical protein